MAPYSQEFAGGWAELTIKACPEIEYFSHRSKTL